MAHRWRRSRESYTQAGGLLLALSLAGRATACTREPAAQELRAQATCPQTSSRRAAEEQGMRAVIARLIALEGLEHVLTRPRDSCARPTKHSVFENNPSHDVLECRMDADVYFGVRGDITDVLARIAAARIAPAGAGQLASRCLEQQRLVEGTLSGSKSTGPLPEAPWGGPVRGNATVGAQPDDRSAAGRSSSSHSGGSGPLAEWQVKGRFHASSTTATASSSLSHDAPRAGVRGRLR